MKKAGKATSAALVALPRDRFIACADGHPTAELGEGMESALRELP